MRPRISKHKEKEVKTYSQAAVNAVIVVVVLLLFLYIGIQFSRSFSSRVSTQRTQISTGVTYSYLDGYIFKDGELLTFDGGDVIHYLVSDGEKVGVGQAYAEVYSNTSLSADDKASTERRLNALSEQIKMLENGMEHSKDASDLGTISDDISSHYYAYIDSVLGADFKSADKTGDGLLGALIDYSSVTLSESAKNVLAELVSERDALISSIGGTKTTLVSDKSFTFYHSPDGYESIFNSSKLDMLTREALDELSKTQADDLNGTFGSAVYSSKWYISIPTDTVGYATFKDGIGTTYKIDFLGEDNVSLEMLLEKIVLDGEDTSRSYLLFSSFDLAKISGIDRVQNVRITLDSCTGYRIPEGAIHHVNDNDGVYILVGNTIEFRRVSVIGRGDGYYIVNTYENDLEQGEVNEVPYLAINDLIVTSGRDLYDGKQLD